MATRRPQDTLELHHREFSSAEVCLVAQISLRQLQWWDERGIVSARQQGHRRMYSAADLIGMMVIAELRSKGFSLQKIRRIVRSVRREIEGRLDELLGGKSELFILTDGKSSSFEDRPERVIDLLKRSRKPLSLVSVRDRVSRLTEFQASRTNQLKLF
jgi:DNA-binding transcriptional MerR regulator